MKPAYVHTNGAVKNARSNYDVACYPMQNIPLLKSGQNIVQLLVAQVDPYYLPKYHTTTMAINLWPVIERNVILSLICCSYFL